VKIKIPVSENDEQKIQLMFTSLLALGLTWLKSQCILRPTSLCSVSLFLTVLKVLNSLSLSPPKSLYLLLSFDHYLLAILLVTRYVYLVLKLQHQPIYFFPDLLNICTIPILSCFHPPELKQDHSYACNSHCTHSCGEANQHA
jgi:hypothetical protein